MAAEYHRTIFNILKVPSPRSFLVAIPMNMYRIKTNKFKYGLDFFQKAIVMLKANPSVKDSTISACLGIGEDLVKQIVGELTFNGYIDGNGILTSRGQELSKNINGLVIDETNQELGYVFQYRDREEYYPFYIKNLGDAPNMSDNNEVIFGTKGDGYEKRKPVYQLDFISDKKRTLPFPSENVLIELIERTSRKRGEMFENKSSTKLNKSLSISYFHETPEPIKVDVLTYIYLPQRDQDDLYEPDWQVLDPFGNDENSAQLKFYLESFRNKAFKDELDHYFADARTLASKNFGDYNSYLEKEVVEMRENDFNVEFLSLDKNLQTYLQSCIKNMFIFRQYGYSDPDSGDMFIISTQKALETLFLIDVEKRKGVYEQMKKEFSSPNNHSKDEYYHKRRGYLIGLTRSRLIRMVVPDRLIRLSKNVEPNKANSLKQYIYNLILTYYFDNQSPLFKLIDGNIEKLFDIAELRNSKGHGHTERSGVDTILSKDVAESSYSFIKEFINRYIAITI